MDERFLSAFTDPARIKILGRFVYPFCLLHRVNLEAAGSPIIKGSDTIRSVDLLIAVKICSGERIDKLTLLDYWHLWKMNRDQKYFEKQLQRFSDYSLISAWPKFWKRSTQSNASGAGVPWPLTVVCNLVSSGISLEQAWTMPESQAIWLNAGIAVGKGAELKVLSTEEEALMDVLEKTPESK